ncbi:MAG TPA: glycosyltransferase [Amycolatopsis sp.]|nr:glycosyltransferase [Amycolatopsis sp.]
MKIVFSALPFYGHIFPLIPFAKAARNAGHDVLFATGADFDSVLRRAGLDPVAVGKPRLDVSLTTIDGLRVAGDDLTPEQALARAGRVYGDDLPRQFVADLGPVLEDFKPDLLLHDPGNPGAGLAAELAGVPAMVHAYGRAPRGALTTAVEHYLAEYAAELGVSLPAEYASTLGNPTVDICPPSLQRADFLALGKRFALRPVAFAEADDVPPFVRHGGRLGYVTLGTIYGAVDLLRRVIDGLVRLGLRVLVATGPSVDPAELGELPASVSIERWVPQAKLWPCVDVAVHHGGSGTMLGALAHGVRQLIVPQAADQPTNARTVAEAGAGLALSPAEVTADAVAEKVNLIMTADSFQEAAHRLRREIEQMPSPADLAARLPDLLSR